MNLIFSYLSPDLPICENLHNSGLSFQFFKDSVKMKIRLKKEVKKNKCWRTSKDNAAYFFDNKSIQTAVESSIFHALLASELSTEIQFKKLDSIQLRRSQTNHKIRKISYFRHCFIEQVCVL